MHRPGIETGRLRHSTLAKSYSNSLCCCYSEPLQHQLFFREYALITQSRIVCRLVCLKAVPVFSGNFDGELAPYFLPLLHVVIPTLHQRHHRCGLLLYSINSTQLTVHFVNIFISTENHICLASLCLQLTAPAIHPKTWSRSNFKKSENEH
jgi:hypothetical protein